MKNRLSTIVFISVCAALGIAATKFSALTSITTIAATNSLTVTVNGVTNLQTSFSNLASNLATNTAIAGQLGNTSNGVVTLETSRNAAVSNSVIAITTAIASRDAALSNRLAVADFVRCNLVNVPFTWWSNTWNNYGGATAVELFARKESSKVFLRGTIRHTSGSSAFAQVVGRLPTSLEPALVGAEYATLQGYDGTNWIIGSASVSPNEQLSMYTTSMASNGLAVVNLNYHAEDYFEAGTNSLNSTNRSLVLFPTPFPASHKLVHLIHGYTGDEYSGAYRWIEGRDTVRTLLTNGWTILCSAGEPSNWGNQWGINTHSNGLYWFTNSFPTTNIVIYSGSMGGLASLNWMAQNSRIQRWYGVYPCLNLGHLYTNSSFTAFIETAFGFTGAGNYAAATAGYDPYRDITTNTFAGRRFRMTASPSDTDVSQAGNANAWSAKHTNTATVTIRQATGAHGDASHFSPTNVLAFFNEP